MTWILDSTGVPLLVHGVLFGAGLLFGLALGTFCLGLFSTGWQALRNWADNRALERRQRKTVPDPRPDPHWDAVRERLEQPPSVTTASEPPGLLSRAACCGCPTVTFDLLHENRTETRIKHRPECPLSVVNALPDAEFISYDEWSRKFGRYPGPGEVRS